MKKRVKELKEKTIKELENEAKELREEIAKINVESKINPSKDSNFLVKKRKKLAVILTILTEKKEQKINN